MNITVLNGSPSGQDSITLFTVRYIEKHFPDHHFRVLDVGQRIRAMEKKKDEWIAEMRAADLIMFCYPVYTFLAPAQLHRFIAMMKESGVSFEGKAATQVTTSKHFYDITAHRYVEDNCHDMGLKVIRGLSADMDDLTGARGRREALQFFENVLWSMEKGIYEPAPVRLPAAQLKAACPEAAKLTGPAPRRVAVVADLSDDSSGRLQSMIARLQSRLACETQVTDIGAFPFAGGCLGCFHCAADGQCVYRDGFSDMLRDKIQTADAIVYAFTIRDHSMGVKLKTFDDRQFCNGHRTVTMGRPVGYLIDGEMSREENLRALIEARAQVGGNALAGTASTERDPDGEIDALAQRLSRYVTEKYVPPRNFYGVGGMKIFRDLIWQMQGLMREDHRFYKAHGFYDFPQKKRGRMMAMYLVGAMMNSPKLRKKLGGRLTEGMTGPYKKALDREPEP